jgi:hypothetical protein
MMRRRKVSATGSCGFFAALTRMKVRPAPGIGGAMAMRGTAAGTVVAAAAGPAVAVEAVGAGETTVVVTMVAEMTAARVATMIDGGPES